MLCLLSCRKKTCFQANGWSVAGQEMRTQEKRRRSRDRRPCLGREGGGGAARGSGAGGLAGASAEAREGSLGGFCAPGLSVGGKGGGVKDERRRCKEEHSKRNNLKCNYFKLRISFSS